MQRVFDKHTHEPYDYPDDWDDNQIAADFAARRAGQPSQGLRHGRTPWQQFGHAVGVVGNAVQQARGMVGGQAGGRAGMTPVPEAPEIRGGDYAFAGSANVNAALDRQQRQQEMSIQAKMKQDQMVQQGLQEEKRLSAMIQLEEQRQKNQERREKLAAKIRERERKEDLERGSFFQTSGGIVHAAHTEDGPVASTIMAAPKNPIRVGDALVDPENYQELYRATPRGGGSAGGRAGGRSGGGRAVSPTQAAYAISTLRRTGMSNEQIASQYPELAPMLEGGEATPAVPQGPELLRLQGDMTRALRDAEEFGGNTAENMVSIMQQVPEGTPPPPGWDAKIREYEAEQERSALMEELKAVHSSAGTKGRAETGQALVNAGFAPELVNQYLDEQRIFDDNSYIPLYRGEQWKAQPKQAEPTAAGGPERREQNGMVFEKQGDKWVRIQ